MDDSGAQALAVRAHAPSLRVWPNLFLHTQNRTFPHRHKADWCFPKAWNRGLIRGIPKTAGACSVEKLRPIALQQLKKKRFLTVLLIQVEDILCQITPPQQVGCIKHRQM